MLGFHAERRRIDTGGAFEELDGPGTTTLLFGSRSGRRDPPPLTPGIDLEAVFPDAPPPTPPGARVHVARRRARHCGERRPAAGEHPPVPALLRRRDRPSLGDRAPRLGRQAREAPGASAAGRAAGPAADRRDRARGRARAPSPGRRPRPPRRGSHAPREQRRTPSCSSGGGRRRSATRDPHATEFRVYWQPLPPDVVGGRLTGVASLASGLYEMAATLDRPIAADAMRGRYIAAPDYPFKVASHTSGQSITVRLEQSVLEPARVPSAAGFEYRPVLNGAELRPTAWAERTAVVPITSAESYQHVFRDRVTIDAASPRARVWAGVSAADGQSYVADELPASATNGGRPGNESSIVAATAAGRFLGRPDVHRARAAARRARARHGRAGRRRDRGADRPARAAPRRDDPGGPSCRPRARRPGLDRGVPERPLRQPDRSDVPRRDDARTTRSRTPATRPPSSPRSAPERPRGSRAVS